MNPREVWQVGNEGGQRLVLSPATYNATGMVITAVVAGPAREFDPFAVPIRDDATVYADRIMYHPRDWLTSPAYRLTGEEWAAVRKHLAFLFDF